MSAPARTMSAVPATSRVTRLALLGAVAAFSVLQSMVLPALPQIRGDLHASLTASSWVLSAFLLVSSVSAVVLGRLGDLFSKKRLLLASVAALLLGSVAAALAPSIAVLIAARALQGLGAAAFPLAYGLVREVVAPERVPAAIGAVSSTFGIGFAVGLVLPAPLLSTMGWPAVFWLSALVDLAALVLIAVGLPAAPARPPARARAAVDWPGAVLLAVALCCLLLGISEIRTWPTPALVLVAVLGAVTLAGFVLRELTAGEPLVQLRLLTNPAVLVADVAGLLVGFALYGAFSVIPQFVQTPATSGYGFGASSLQSGLLLLPTAITMVIVGPAAGRAGARHGHAQTLAVGGLTGVVGYAVLVLGSDSIWLIVACTTILGVAVGLALTAMANLIVGSVEPAVTGQATGLNTILRTIGGALGAQVSAALIASAGAPQDGYRAAFVTCGAALALTAAAALTAVRRAAL